MLPSYSEATSSDQWKLIAPYVASQDLCAASRTCNHWHEIFTPQLWGNPASHFETADDSVYAALTRFQRTLPSARRSVRWMTHTLRIPAAHAENYGGPHSEWLREMLQKLPGLQCLVVKSLEFLDHECLMALRVPLRVESRLEISALGSTLRLLNAARCVNVSYSGLAAALKQFSGLWRLDLSETSAARHSSVLRAMSCMGELQSLKLRNVGLDDDALGILAAAISVRVKSLDLSNNLLTDAGARTLLDTCFRHRTSSQPSNLPYEASTTRDGDLFHPYCGEALTTYLQTSLTGDPTERAVIHYDNEPGLTYLYISENDLTVEGISSLLATGRLRCLDAGSMTKAQLYNDTRTGSYAPSGAERLVESIKKVPPERLVYLRVHHDFVTQRTPSVSCHSIQLCGPNRVVPAPKGEIGQETGGEQASDGNLLDSDLELCSAPGHRFEAVLEHQTNTRRISPTENEKSASASGNELTATLFSPSRDYSHLVESRKARVAHHRAHAEGFVPLLAPQLQTLVLCDVPERTFDDTIPSRIIELIEACASEQSLAMIEARSNYARPPGPNQSAFDLHYSRSIFALDRIILEMSDPSVPATRSSAAAGWISQAQSKATTDDIDSEALWDEAKHDFTFFSEGESDESLEPFTSKGSRYIGSDAIITEPPNPAGSHDTTNSEHSAERPLPSVDVVAKVAKFRSERSAGKEARLSSANPDDVVAGFWKGVVQITRPYLDR